MTVENIYDKQTPTHKQVIRYSIHTLDVPFSGEEEEGNEQPSKQKEKERNIGINKKEISIEIKPELSQ